jgi:hypothetical protein
MELVAKGLKRLILKTLQKHQIPNYFNFFYLNTIYEHLEFI